jgi:pimeloyl-ACP methyl ester carboxylesterase
METTRPLRTIPRPAREDGASRTWLALLPPAYAGPEHFLEHGFVAAAHARTDAPDVMLVEMGMQQLLDRSVLQHLRDEIVLPARARGVTLWLVGISLGGLVALACAEACADDVDGLCLLAPYLGSHLVTGEIERARGLAGWQPGEPGEDDDERRAWRFIQRQMPRSHPMSEGDAGARDPRPGTPALHLGFGAEDRFAASHRMMAQALSPGQVDVVSGGHDWRTWRQLWDNFLDSHRF